MLEINYLRFLARAVDDEKLFRKLWCQAILRLKLRAARSPAAHDALRAAPALALQGGPATSATYPEEAFLALTNGSVAVFPGGAQTGKPRMVVATPSLTRRKHVLNEPCDQVFVSFADTLEAPPAEILSTCAEAVLVRRAKGPDGNAAAFRPALRQTLLKWRPVEARLETKGMVQYTSDCAPARIILA
jgi:hypothetical protein